MTATPAPGVYNADQAVAMAAPRPPGPYDDPVVSAAWAAGEAWARREHAAEAADQAERDVVEAWRAREAARIAAVESAEPVDTCEPGPPQQRVVVDAHHGEDGVIRIDVNLLVTPTTDPAIEAVVDELGRAVRRELTRARQR